MYRFKVERRGHRSYVELMLTIIIISSFLVA